MYSLTSYVLLQEFIFPEPSFGNVHLLKADISDGFYGIPIRTLDASKLDLAFPEIRTSKPFFTIPLVLPMGMTTSPPCFFAEIKTVANLVTKALGAFAPALTHLLEDHTDSAPPAEPHAGNAAAD